MAIIDSVAAQKFQPELLSGESIYWAGMPNPSIVFHSEDLGLIPFSLLWGGFAIFWEAIVLGYWGNTPRSSSPSIFGVLWGIPFVVVGQYLIWGRFVVDAWLKRRTYYAVTNRRVLLLQESWKRKSKFIFLDSLPELSRDGTSTGTVWLGPKYPSFGGRGRASRGWSRFSMSSLVPALADIDNPDYVERLILELREKSRSLPESASS